MKEAGTSKKTAIESNRSDLIGISADLTASPNLCGQVGESRSPATGQTRLRTSHKTSTRPPKKAGYQEMWGYGSVR
jgi:hypothetical protein